MNVLVAFLAVTGALAWLTVISGFIFGVFFRAASAEDRATVDLPDVDMDERLSPFVDNVRVLDASHPHVATSPGAEHWRVLGPWITSHDPAACDACAGLDRGGF